ncbi:MAG: proteasome subunit beta [Thermoproteota archaeon]|nr:MAG: proteasome subunit beta [Candidatus Korarchaeota archaeon]
MHMVLATAIGLVTKDGVVLSADRRVSYGDGYILSKSVKKVFTLNEMVGVASAGIPADFQSLVDSLIFNVRLYELDTRRRAKPSNIARILSVILYQRRMYSPYFAEMIVGGLEDDLPKLFVLDPAGSSLEDKYAAVGSGAKLAIGILERSYSPDMSSEEAIKVAERAMRGAIERDALSGDGIDILFIGKEGKIEKFIPLKLA